MRYSKFVSILGAGLLVACAFAVDADAQGKGGGGVLAAAAGAAGRRSEAAPRRPDRGEGLGVRAWSVRVAACTEVRGTAGTVRTTIRTAIPTTAIRASRSASPSAIRTFTAPTAIRTTPPTTVIPIMDIRITAPTAIRTGTAATRRLLPDTSA